MGRRMNGMGTVYWRGSMRCWYGLVTVGTKPDGTRDRRAVRGKPGDNSTQERDRVTLELAGLKVQASKGVLPSRDATITLENFVPDWERDFLVDRSPVTAQSYVYTVNHYVLPVFGKRKLQDIRRLDVQQLLNGLHRAGKGAETLRQVRAALGSCLRAAVEWEILPFNAASTARLPAMQSVVELENDQILSVEDGLKLLAGTRGTPGYAVWLLMLGCGLRSGEACGLSWADIDWSRRELVVRQAMKSLRSDRGGPSLGPPKSKKARRIPLPAFVLSELSEIRQRQILLVTTLRDEWRASELVVQTASGTCFTPHVVYKRLRQDLDRLEIPRVRPHILRHTCATLLKRQKVEREIIQHILGHAKWDTTQIYAGHTSLEDMRGAADQLDSLFGNDTGYKPLEPN